MSEEYEIIFITEEGRAIKNNKTGKIYYSEFEIIDEKNKEIERLNNIINELGKYLIEEIEDYDKHINSQYITDITREQYEGEKVCFEDTLCKLQELKGSDKECQ